MISRRRSRAAKEEMEGEKEHNGETFRGGREKESEGEREESMSVW